MCPLRHNFSSTCSAVSYPSPPCTCDTCPAALITPKLNPLFCSLSHSCVPCVCAPGYSICIGASAYVHSLTHAHAHTRTHTHSHSHALSIIHAISLHICETHSHERRTRAFAPSIGHRRRRLSPYSQQLPTTLSLPLPSFYPPLLPPPLPLSLCTVTRALTHR